MLIVLLNNHRIIISKSWMNRHKVILNMLYDRIVFKSNRCKHFEAIFNHVSLKSNQNSASSRRSSTWTLETFVTFVITETFKYIILKKKSVFNQVIKENAVDSRSISVLFETSINSVELNSFESRSDLAQACWVEFVSNQNQTNHQLTTRAEPRQLTICLNIASVSAAAFYRLSNRVHRRQNVQCFSLIIFIIIEKLTRRAKIKAAYSEFNTLTKLTMNQVLEKLFKEFHDLKEAFDRSKIFQLSSHKLYDHKIELEGSQFQMPKSRVYQMSTSKLMETKKYLEKNFKKKFISFNFVFYVSLIFFAAKLNKSLRFCVDYRKLNVIIKKNRYSIFFIEETLVRVMNCKYLTKLNIIAVFNKLRMHLNSEDLITFVTFMKIYKYYVLSFDLTNESANY